MDIDLVKRRKNKRKLIMRSIFILISIWLIGLMITIIWSDDVVKTPVKLLFITICILLVSLFAMIFWEFLIKD